MGNTCECVIKRKLINLIKNKKDKKDDVILMVTMIDNISIFNRHNDKWVIIILAII